MAASKRRLFLVVDRIEGRVAVLQDDNGNSFDVAVRLFKSKPREGQVFYSSGKQMVRDQAEERRRIKFEQTRLRTLGARDPGGDLTL